MAEAAAKNQEFEAPAGGGFPDPTNAVEIDTDGVGSIDVEIIDDTPLEDRVDARPAAERTDMDDPALEEEVSNYSEAAQQRIKTMKFEFHEERRAKEAAQRQNTEALSYAERAAQENNALKKGIEKSNNVVLEQFEARTDAELEQARESFKDAYDEGDTDALLKAQENISRLQAERINVLNRVGPKPEGDPVGQPQQPQQQPSQQQQTAPPDARGMQWIKLNPWFQRKGDEDMTGYAIGLHEQLIGAGYDPRVHEEYYQKIDEGMKTLFSDRFAGGTNGGDGELLAPAATPARKPPPVGGPSRGGTPPRKVQLTATQVTLAKRLGLSNKQYAAQVAKEQLNG